MRYVHEATVSAPPAAVFGLVAAVERYPVLVPHHWRVDLLEDAPDGARRAKMWATHWGVPVPPWTLIQRRYPEEGRIELELVGGLIRGMRVEWRLGPLEGGRGTRVELFHEWNPRWPLVGPFLADRVIGPVVVERMVRKTLGRIKDLAEAGVRLGP